MSWFEPDWEGHNFLLSSPYLAGTFLSDGFPDALSWNEPSVLVARKTHAQTHKVWRPFTEAKAPTGLSGVNISIDAYTVSKADYRLLQSLSRSGQVHQYADGRPVIDRFQNAVSGTTVKLSRPLALGIVAGVTEEFFPTTVILDGVVDAGAATVLGQTVTVNTSGVLEIEYTPVYNVIISGNGWSIGGFNDLQFDSFAMEEVIQTSFV